MPPAFDTKLDQVTALRRRAERRACKLEAILRVRGHSIRCTVVNISEGGAGITTDSIAQLQTGQVVILSAQPLGDLTCVVRWRADLHYGLEFDATGSRSPAVHAFFDSLPISA